MCLCTPGRVASLQYTILVWLGADAGLAPGRTVHYDVIDDFPV
jgi:hypothetical protein